MTNDEIKEWCRKNKVTQGQLAEEIGYSENAVRSALNGLIKMQTRMHDAIMRIITSHGKPDMTIVFTDERKREIQKRARLLGQSVEQFILSAIGETLGVDLSNYKDNIHVKNWQGYPIDEEGEDPTALQASEGEES